MKKRNSRCLIFVSIMLVILMANLIIADFTLGNPASDIEEVYGPGEFLRGWINISFENQKVDSILRGFTKNINLLSFLQESNADYSCSPSDCEDSYSSSNGMATKVLNFIPGDKNLIGIKLTGQIDKINSMVFDIDFLGSTGSCSIPLKIDILNDGMIEWESQDVSDKLCHIMSNPYGCYDEADSSDKFLITEDPYCAKTNVETGKGFKIGADITETAGKGGDVYFRMQINSGLESQDCSVEANTSGSISCFVELEEGITSPTEIEICINAEDEGDNGKYEIKYEGVTPCGSAGEIEYDFPIFIYPLEYAGISSLVFNQILIDQGYSGVDISDKISNYISNKYDNNCDPECVIPISFYSGETQDLTISNLDLIYVVGGSKSETMIYDINKTKTTINSDFQKIWLEKTNFTTPFVIGSGEFILGLDNEEILRTDIKIVPSSTIQGFLPDKAAALVPTEFTIYLSGESGNLKYTWDFGDKSTIEVSDTNKIEHTYANTGEYSVKLKIENEFTNDTRTFLVEVIPPEEAILNFLNEYRENVIVLKSQIQALPAWIQQGIKPIFDINSIELDLDSYDAQYERAFDEKSYVNLMKILLESEVPSNFIISQEIPKGALFLDDSQLNLEVLESLGAGKIIEEENYGDLINTWLATSLDAFIEFKTYALEYRRGIEDLVSYVKVTLEPKETLSEIYFIVNEDPYKINFIDESKTKSVGENAEVLILTDISESKIIEFLYPGAIEIGNFPIYISPEFRDLTFPTRPGVCNFNDVCEKDLGETYKNCRSDCKPVALIFLFLSVLIFIFLFIYIVLQEWYKRHYESKLFPDKNQLFNLINFINNSLNQGLKKSTIFDSLKDLDWSNEQLTYAWNKFNGKRTGLWEIPIFKWVENKKVRKEIAKRQNIQIQTPNGVQKRVPSRIRKMVRRNIKRPPTRIRKQKLN